VVDHRVDVAAHRLDVAIDRQFRECVLLELRELNVEHVSYKLGGQQPRLLLRLLLAAKGIGFGPQDERYERQRRGSRNAERHGQMLTSDV
jgi:hypothetical protein